MKLTKNQAIVIIGAAIMFVLVCSVTYVAGVALHQAAHVF
jgi:hypothetical protein